jgi:hypothetical protein
MSGTSMKSTASSGKCSAAASTLTASLALLCRYSLMAFSCTVFAECCRPPDAAADAAEHCAAAAAAEVSPARPASAVTISRLAASCEARRCASAARPSSRRCVLPAAPLPLLPAAAGTAPEAAGLCIACCAWS